MKKLRVILLSLAILLAIMLGNSMPTWAQSSSTATSIRGEIKDEQGAVLTGVTVVVTNINTNLRRETNSDEKGNYILTDLPPGLYTVDLMAEGFKKQTLRIELELGASARVPIVLNLGNVSDVIEVNANELVQEEDKTESSTNNSRDRIDGLPINRRDFLDFSLTAARVRTDRVPAQGAASSSQLSFNAQTARQNNVTIDGLDNNDIGSGSVRSTFSQDAVQEFQVVSDSYSAEFGRAIGGVVNIVTRGGGNQFHGNLFFFDRNDSTSARNAFANINPEYKQYQFGGLVSGALKKDRAFFFLSFERRSIKQNNIVAITDSTIASIRRQGFIINNGARPFAIDGSTFLARTDFHLTPNDNLYVRYNFGGNYNGGFEPFDDGLTAESSTGIQRLTDKSLAINNSFLSTKLNLINETRFLYTQRDQDINPADTSPLVKLVAPEGGLTFGRGAFLPQPRSIRITQFIDNVSMVRGRHQIKFGVDYLHINTPRLKVPIFAGGLALIGPLDFAALTGTPGLPAFTGLQAFDPTLRTPQQLAFLGFLSNVAPQMFAGFPSNVPFPQLSLPTAYVQGFIGDPKPIPATLFAGFVQDDIKIKPNLLLKLGVRYDINRVRFVPNNNGNFSPRVALSYRPKQFKYLNIRATYGLFFGVEPLPGPGTVVQTTSTGILKLAVVPFPFAVLPFSQPGHHLPETTEPPPGLFVPQLSQTYQFAKDIRNNYTQQTSFGFDYLLGKNMVFSATYDYVRGLKLFSQRNVNPIVRPVLGNPVASALTGRPDTNRGDVIQFESSFDSYYHGVTLSLSRRLSNHVGLIAHYTYSKAIDDYIDFRTDLEEGVAVDPLNPRQERALSLQDVRNRFVLSGTWDLSYTKNRFLTGFQLATIVNVESGRPYNLLAGVDLNMNGDNQPPGDRPLIGGTTIGRNLGILPSFTNFDVRLTRTISIKERIQIQGIVDVFNLFNHTNINKIDRIFPPDAKLNFKLPPQENGRFVATPDRYRSAFAPRQIQLGFRLSF